MSFEENDRKAIAYAGGRKYHLQGYKGQGINIAVIDSGINPHAEFEDRIRYDLSKNFCVSATDPDDLLDESHSGHGTGVASLIAGKNCGVAPLATVTSLKVFNGLNETEDDSVVNALTYVRDNIDLFDAVNMSLGWGKYMSYYLKLKVESLIEQIVAKGVPVFCAAGNSGEEEYCYPASFQSVISVGALDIEKKTCWFTTMNDEVDVAQIGANVKIAALNGGYAYGTGTSFACPIVVGIFALIASKYKALFHRRIPEPVAYEMIKMNTVDVDIEGIDKKSGCGLCTLGSGKHFEFKAGKKEYKLDGVEKTMDVPVILKNGRTYIPIRFAAEPLGAEAFFTYHEDGGVTEIIG